MSGIYIPNMQMPTDDYDDKMEPTAVWVYPNGYAVVDRGRTQQYTRAIPVPDHGRLIDADALDIYRREEQAWIDYNLDHHNEYLEGVKDGLHEAAKQLSTAPTIIPAREEGE